MELSANGEYLRVTLTELLIPTMFDYGVSAEIHFEKVI